MIEEKLRAFFAEYPHGAGAQWIATHLGATREEVDRACAALGCRRVERRIPVLSAPGAKVDPKALPIPPEIGVEWRAPPA